MDTVDKILSMLNEWDADSVASTSLSDDQLASDWLSRGGVAANGVTYGSPNSATAWGTQGCPILPNAMRSELQGEPLPNELNRIFGESLTFDQLDSDILHQLGIEKLSPEQQIVLRNSIYHITLPKDMTVIPAGVPWQWLEALPVTSRSRNSLHRAFRDTGVDTYLRSPLVAERFMSFRNVGVMTLIDWMCVIESAELGQPISEGILETGSSNHLDDQTISVSLPIMKEAINRAASYLIEDMSPLTSDVNRFARWALAETDAETLEEAIRAIVARPASPSEWTSLAATNLGDLVSQPDHPYAILDAWAEQLDSRRRDILQTRIAVHQPIKKTLQELADSFGVSRERVRQLEHNLHHKLERFLAKDDEALPIRWRAETLRQAIGVAVPSHIVKNLLAPPPNCYDYYYILLDLAGPYDYDKEWLIDIETLEDDPTHTILENVDEVGRINHEFARAQLSEWGLDERFHEDWLMRDDSVRLFNGRLVLWGSSIGDRMVFALDNLGRASTIEEMIDHIQENRSRVSIVNVLGTDPRLVRVDRTHWALKSWDLPEYTGVAYSMREILYQNDGAMPIDELVQRMSYIFDVREETTRAYCYAPMFVSDGDIVELRTLGHGPYQANLSSIRTATGVFHLGHGRVGLTIQIDANILRGSGSPLSQAAGAILGLAVNANLKFTNQVGDTVNVTFPESSIVGPHRGSVRLIAERLSAKEDDLLTIILDISDMSVTAWATDLSDYSPNWDTIGRLTGIGSPRGISDLANALRCNAGEVRDILMKRGDTAVLDFLPTASPSAFVEERAQLSLTDDRF